MALILRDFQCPLCNHSFEDLVNSSNETHCPNCGNMDVELQMSAPNLNTMNMLPPSEFKKKMLKRSEEHTKREVAKELGKNGVIGIKK